MKVIFLFLVAIFGYKVCKAEDVRVTLDNLGTIVGERIPFVYNDPPAVNRPIDTFKGIPYAEPPVGNLRLKKTVAKEPWQGDYIAKKFRNRCWSWRNVSFTDFLKEPQGENCLFLNIWTPEAKEGNNYAVMIWIHGGGFDWGTGTSIIYDGDALAAYNDVVTVTINYRLNGHGFLSTGDRVIPGNFGIWDQHQAMTWVKTHISKFGGNPEKITLFGQSAGAGSVGFHILSPHSRDLFNNGILMSGSPYWVGNNPEGARRSAFRAGENLGCVNLTTSEQLLNCLQGIDERTFAYEMISTPSGPILDYDFFPDMPENIINQRLAKPCEIMLGTTKDDGSLTAMFLFVDQGFTDDPQCDRARWRRNLERYSGGNEYVADAIDLQYTDWSKADDPDANYFYDFIAMSTDTSTCGQEPMAREWANWGLDVYRYSFFYEPVNSIYPRVPTWKGVAHGDEMQFVFGNQFQSQFANLTFPEKEITLSLDMMRHYTNFAKTGNPNEGGDNDGNNTNEEPYWPRFKLPDRIFKLHEPEMRDVNAYRADYCALWQRFLPRLRAFTDPMSDVMADWQNEYSIWDNVWMPTWRTEFADYQASNPPCN
ncbi:Acetylcholinesterase [Holothuria leucospilota]|uniref:Carboxylic ester hydrolase n=1 Tax=Holothuria leucospilota TaxID=206669 RepID=A0A9Q1BY34_HOLLE|nr:Acetylcholinesterase [Holothuria leucospilota]